MGEFFVEIPLSLLQKAFGFAEEDLETGGHLIVSITRDRDKIIYTIERMEERTLKRAPASATLNTGGPHLWHTHPKSLGIRMSSVDEQSLCALWGLQAISLYGTPPLFLVFGMLKASEDVILYNVKRGLACRNAGWSLGFKAYIAVPSFKTVSVATLGRMRFDWRMVDGDECLLFQDGPSLRPVAPGLVISVVRDHSLRYPESVKSLLSLIRGVCSRGLAPDHLDLMRLVSLRNTLVRLGVMPRHFIVAKENGLSYRVTLGNPVYPEILEPEVRVVENESHG